MDCVSLMALLFGAYGKSGEYERQSMYVMMLSDVPVEMLELAVKKLIRESTFLPSIAEIISTSRELYIAANPDLKEADFDEVWEDVTNAIKTYGIYKPPVFKYARTAKVVEKLGWRHLCMVPENYYGAVRERAEKVFNAIAKREKTAANNEYYLTGNNVLGLPKPEEMLLKLSGSSKVDNQKS